MRDISVVLCCNLHTGSEVVGLFLVSHATIPASKTTVLAMGFGTVLGIHHYAVDTVNQRLSNKQAGQNLTLQSKTTRRIEAPKDHLRHPISITNTYIKGPSLFSTPHLISENLADVASCLQMAMQVTNNLSLPLDQQRNVERELG